MSSAEEPAVDEREDRQMIELLNELRVALPGVQVLFGFLLVVPFSARFDEVTDFQRDVYFVTVLLTVLTTACLIAPSAAHRVLFHRGERPWLIAHANRMLIGGLGFLALALVSAMLLITDFLFGGPASYVVPPLTGAVLAGLWFALPLSRR